MQSLEIAVFGASDPEGFVADSFDAELDEISDVGLAEQLEKVLGALVS